MGRHLAVVEICSVLVLAGCGLSGPGREARVPAKRETMATGQPASPQGRDPTERPIVVAPRSRSPQQVAALDRVDRAKALIAAGRYGQAIAHLEKTLAMDSTSPHTYFHLARAHHGLANYRESLDFLEVAESFLDDDNTSLTNIWVLKGDNLRALGKWAEARRSYEKALVTDPGNEKATRRLGRIGETSF